VSLISLEPNSNSQTATDPTSITSRQQALLSLEKSLSSDDSGPSKPEENGLVEVEPKEIESRDITEACEAVNGDLEGVGENIEPSSEPFVGSGDSSEITEPADAVVAWSPDEDHEHKRVKVRLYVTSHICRIFRHVIPMHRYQVVLIPLKRPLLTTGFTTHVAQRHCALYDEPTCYSI
jgi:hypothetical protein